jgi:uncharacterized protein with von Willebrand factor type A (vWA) domain
MPGSFRYSRWDGTQAGFALDGDDVLGELADDVLYHGDLHAALRRLLQSGFRDRDQRDVAGLREILERLRRRRQAELERSDLGSVYGGIARELREIVEQERQELDRLAGTDPAAAADRSMALDLLPSDLAGQVRSLRQYEFASDQAAERFDRLLEELRRQLVASQFNRMAGAMSSMGPEETARLKDMLAALNALLDARARGEPGEERRFADFMARFGDFFPGDPGSLDELLEQLARQMAAMQALLNSMTPEQRAELAALADELLGDLDLRWQLDQLGHSLQAAFPGMGWERSYEPRGMDPLSLLEGARLMDRLGQLDELEHLLRSAMVPGALTEVDLEAARDLLGDDTARSLERLAELTRLLEEAGLIEQREGRYELTPLGMRRIGQRALADLFGCLAKDRLGGHEIDRSGPGVERTYESKPYEFGDPFHLDIGRTVRNAVRRSGRGVPVRLDPEDFEVDGTETRTRSSTVLALDLSLSMPMRDNFLAAKKVAMALHALISSKYPQDYLGLVGFSEVARTLRPEQLPEVSWDFVWGTNLQHALLLARRLLARQPGSRQVILVTDGEPTAHVLPDGEVFFHYPPTRETIEATLLEAARCTAEGIRINTFMLDATERLRSFVERLARLNRGRVFLTTPDTLGSYVLVDFLEHKRGLRRRAG